MPHPCPHHCPDGSGHGFVLLAAAVLIIAAIARPVAHAAGDVLHAVAEALEVAAIVLASAAGLAVLAGMAYGGVRLYRWHAKARWAIPQRAQAGQALTEAHRAAIEAPRQLPVVHVITDAVRERRRSS